MKMKRYIPRLLALVPLALALSGCGVLQKLGLVHGNKGTRGVPELAHADLLTQLGRSQLDNAQPGLAAKTFEQALANGERPAPAFNGLGVSYAKIGKTALAAKFFTMAAQADPENQSYQANLALLYRSAQMARLSHSPRPPAEATNPSGGGYAVPVGGVEGRLVRLSPVEVEIKTAPFASKRPVTNAVVRIDLDSTVGLRKRRRQQ